MESLKNFNGQNYFKVFILVILYTLTYLLCGGIMQYVAVLLTDQQPIDLDSPEVYRDKISTMQNLVISTFDLIAVTIITFYFLKQHEIPWRKIGFKFNLNKILQGFILGGIFIALFFVLFNLFNQIKVYEIPLDCTEVVLLIGFLFVAALSEELMFRGYFLNMMQKYLSPFWSITISSLLFALFHIFNPNLNWIAMIELFAAGIVMAYAYVKTGNLWFVTFLHFSWNLVQSLLGFNVSGQDFYSFYEFALIKDNFITGGDFGFEGSIFSIFVEIVTFFILSQYKRDSQ